MEQLIRKILNYDFENITYLQRLKLAKEILRHFENEIPNKTSYNKPKLHLLIDEFNEHKESISVNNKILLKTNTFTNNDGQNLFEDMHTIAHECYHGGQHGMVQTKNKDSSSPIFNFVPDHYQEIFLRYKLKIYEGVIASALSLNQLKINTIETKLTQAQNYLLGFYFLQPIEKEANDFAYNCLNDLFECAKSMNLNDNEKNRLQSLIDGCKKFNQEYENGIKPYIRAKDNDQIRKEILGFVNKEITDFLSNNPKLIEKLKNFNDKDLFEFENKYDISLTFLINSLELSCNDNIKHKLLNSLLDNKYQGEFCKSLLLHLILYTNIVLTPEEEQKAQEIIDNFEDFPINFNTILEQKLNIQKYKDKYLNPQQPNFKTSPIK
jgi:hypothetical protein